MKGFGLGIFLVVQHKRIIYLENFERDLIQQQQQNFGRDLMSNEILLNIG